MNPDILIILYVFAVWSITFPLALWMLHRHLVAIDRKDRIIRRLERLP